MKDLTIGNEGKLIVQFAMPMVYGNIFQQLYNVVDSIIIGHYLGKESLAAVGASFPIIFLLIALMIGFSMGFTIIIAQYFGAKNMVKVKQTIDTSYIIILFASLITTLLGISFSETIFRLTGMPDEVIPDAATYLNIYFAGSIFSYAFNGISAILRGLGDSRTPLIFLIISTISNVFLDLLFIVVFKMGIAGAAYATIISKAGAVVAAIIYINKKFPIMNISFRRYEFVWDIFKTSLRIGLPTGLQQTFVATGLIALYGIVNKFGTVTIAAYGVANRIDTFASMLAMNFASALSAFQFAICSFLSILVALFTENIEFNLLIEAAIPILYGGIFSVGLAFTLQVAGQKDAPAASASIILSLEALFAVIGGWLILNEYMSLRSIFGCILMLAGMILAQLAISKKSKIG
jgi:putative MATE family efflux protein